MPFTLWGKRNYRDQEKLSIHQALVKSWDGPLPADDAPAEYILCQKTVWLGSWTEKVELKSLGFPARHLTATGHLDYFQITMGP